MSPLITIKSASLANVSSSQDAFDSEFDLVNSLQFLVRKQFKKSIGFEREFDCGFGIADAILFECKKRKSALNLGQLTPAWAYTLKQLPLKTNFDANHISKISGASISLSKKAIKEFVDAGYCKQKENGIYVKIKEPENIVDTIKAVEAKLKDWKRALWQASRYKTFANESWVVLDKKHANPAIKNIDEFKRYNIGLATISIEGDYLVHFSPIEETHFSEIAYWKANVMIAQSLLN